MVRLETTGSKAMPASRELLVLINKMKNELEAWEETLQILSDEKLMKALKRSMKDVEKGRVITFSSVDELRQKYR